MGLGRSNHRIYLKVEKATGGNPNLGDRQRGISMGGLVGINFHYPAIPWRRKTQTGNVWNWRFTFRTCSTKFTFNDDDLSENYSTAPKVFFI